MIYRDQGNNPAAVETFRQIVALGGDEDIERGYQQIIDTWREAKEWQKATDTAKEAVQKLPTSRDLKMVSGFAAGGHGPRPTRRSKMSVRC